MLHCIFSGDPGFPSVGGGGANLRHIHFSAKTYAKTKEMDFVGGCTLVVPPGSANDIGIFIECPESRHVVSGI